MRTLTFNDNERTLALEILEAYLEDLPHEIHKTDNQAFRDRLKEKKIAVEQLVKKLQES